ncbi:nucleoside hydrolase [Streptosporangium lutulentum]
MRPQKIIIDCDPGIDDALAIVLAHGSPDLEILGITTVGGNVGLAGTTDNALRLREFLGFTGVPITPGSAGALLRTRVDAARVHGPSGLGAALLPPATLPVSGGHAVDFIVETLRAAPGEVTLVAIGPLTNVALAVLKEPRIVDWAKGLTILGGSYTRGNFSRRRVQHRRRPGGRRDRLRRRWTVTMIGLDVSRGAMTTEAVADRMRTMGRLGTDLLIPCVEYYGVITADSGPAIHDACAIAYLIDPSLITVEPAVVDVETAGRFTSGMTVTDFRPVDRTPNALVGTSLDAAASGTSS